jgi:hypothetical protein
MMRMAVKCVSSILTWKEMHFEATKHHKPGSTTEKGKRHCFIVQLQQAWLAVVFLVMRIEGGSVIAGPNSISRERVTHLQWNMSPGVLQVICCITLHVAFDCL